MSVLLVQRATPWCPTYKWWWDDDYQDDLLCMYRFGVWTIWILIYCWYWFINLIEQEPPASVGRRRWRRHKSLGGFGCLKILPEKNVIKNQYFQTYFNAHLDHWKVEVDYVVVEPVQTLQSLKVLACYANPEKLYFSSFMALHWKSAFLYRFRRMKQKARTFV